MTDYVVTGYWTPDDYVGLSTGIPSDGTAVQYTGAVVSASTTTITTDTTAFAGETPVGTTTVVVIKPDNSSEKRTVSKISGATITVAQPFTTTPTSSDVFVLSVYSYATAFAELQKAAPSSIIELFELQLFSDIHGSNDVYRFHAGSNANGNGDLIWVGNVYQRFPVEAEGFEYSGNGQLPRPKIRCSNILGTITALLLSLPDGLEGAKVTRIRTLARYIDGGNFAGGVNPYGTPDPTAEFPREIFYIDRKTSETRDVVEFELAAAFDLAGVRAPKRQCIANICQWIYRSTECGYDPVGPAARPLREHYAAFGYGEGRNINSTGQFNATYYLATYGDVAAVYTLATANEHFRNYGIWEGRLGNAGGMFDANYYLSTYPDLNVLVYFNEADQGVSTQAADVCGKRLSSCKARFGTTAELPFGSYPGVGTYFS